MRRVLHVTAVVLALAGCGSGHSARPSLSKPSGPAYTSVAELAAKLRAAGLGCAKWQQSPVDIKVDGVVSPTAKQICDIGNGAVGHVISQIALYDNAAAVQRALDEGRQLACSFGAKQMTYEVVGANWQIGAAYNAPLAAKMAAATGGSVSHAKSC